MPRSLEFKFGKKQFSCPINKIDRRKVYGSVQVISTDHEGEEAELFTLARDGRTLIGLGGTGAGYVNTDGLWVESGERIPVDAEGDPMELIESSFDAPIKLAEKVTEDVLLDHPVRLAYHLDADELPGTLRKRLDEGAIYHFGFSYRGGPVADPAFLLTDTDGDLWLLIGNEAEVDYRSLQQSAMCAAASIDEIEDDSDDDNFDFDML